MPHVALESVAGEEVAVPQVATKSKRQVAIRGKQSGGKVATGGKRRSDRDPVVEFLQTSKGTHAFRLRYNSKPGRPAEYVLWVANSVFEQITSDPAVYAQYKAQLIALRRSNEK